MSTELPLEKITPIDARQGELAARVASGAPSDGAHATAFAPLELIRASQVGQPLPAMYVPSFCVVVQGRKRAIVGDRSYYYDAFNHLIVSITLPVFSQIVEASLERPYLCLRIAVDIREVSELMLQIAPTQSAEPTDSPVYVARSPVELLDATLRLLRLLDTPTDLPVLAPLVQKEIWYRLLQSPMEHRLRALVAADGVVQRVNRAIELLRLNYNRTIRVEELAEASHMSTSVFHARFKAVTSLSPLQFQKHLRLHAARRLMVTDDTDAAAAAHQVGYESTSQFSREYRRLFGSPPRQDILALRTGTHLK